MKLFIYTFICSTLFLPISAFSAEVIVIDEVLASVNGDPLTSADLNRYLESVGKVAIEGLTSEQKQEYLREMVAMQLLEKESETLGISVGSDEVDAYIKEIQRQNGVGDEQFNALLKEQGLNRKSYQEQVKRDIMKTRIISRQIRKRITISDEDVKRYLEENPELKPQTGSVRLQQISIPIRVEKGNVLEKQAAAENLINSIRIQLAEKKEKDEIPALREIAPEEFFKDLGFVVANDLREDLKEIVKELEPGILSKAIVAPQSVEAYMVLSSVSSDGDIDEILIEEIRRVLYEKQYQTTAEEYLNETLPKKYLVEFLL